MDDLNELTDEQLAGWKAQNQAVLDRDTLSDPEKLRGLSDDELTGLKQRQHEVLLAPFREQARAGQGAYTVGEGTGSYLGRQFVSPLRSIPMSLAYGVAKDRLNRNEHSDSDLRAIAAYEHEQGLDQAQPEWAKWAGVAAAAPGTVAEFGLAPGLSFAAHAGAGAVAQGGLNAESLLKGGAQAAVQVGVLKSLGPIAKTIFPQAEGILATAGTHALTGSVGLALADYGTKLAGLSESGGPIGEALAGHYGEAARGFVANAILTGGTGAFDAIQKGYSKKVATEKAVENVQKVAEQAATQAVQEEVRNPKLKIGDTEVLTPQSKDLNPAERYAVDKYGENKVLRVGLNGPDGPMGSATLAEEGDTIHVAWVGKTGLAGGEGRGKNLFGAREVFSLATQLAEAMPEAKFLKYTVSEGRIGEGKAKIVDLDAIRRRGKPNPDKNPATVSGLEEPQAPTLKTGASEPRPEPVNASQPAPEAPGVSNAKTPPTMSADEARAWIALRGLKAPESDAVAIAKAEKLVAEAKAKGAVGVKRPTGEAPPEGPSIAEDVARQQAQQLIDSVDQGGQPAFVSQKLKATAAGVGVEVKGSDTPRDVVEKIRVAVRTSTPENAGKSPEPEQKPLENAAQQPKAVDPLADAYFRKGITKRDQQIHGRVITGEPMEDIAKDLGMKNRQAVHAALKRVDAKLPEQFRSAEIQKQLKLREVEGQPTKPEGATVATLRANAEKIAREQQTKLAEAADAELQRAAEFHGSEFKEELRTQLGPKVQPIERTQYASGRTSEYAKENLLRRSWGATTLFDYVVSRGGLNVDSLKKNGIDYEAMAKESGIPRALFAHKKGLKIDELADEFFGEGKGIESGFPFGRLDDASQGVDRIVELIRDHAMIDPGGWHEHQAEVADKLLELEERRARQAASRSGEAQSAVEEAVRSGQEAANAQEPRDEGTSESDVGADPGDFNPAELESPKSAPDPARVAALMKLGYARWAAEERAALEAAKQQHPQQAMGAAALGELTGGESPKDAAATAVEAAKQNSEGLESIDYQKELGYAWAEADPAVREELEPHMLAAGLKPNPKAGEVVPFHNAQHDSGDAIPSVGQKVQVISPGWEVPAGKDREFAFRVARAAVEPEARFTDRVADLKKAGYSQRAAEERAAEEQGYRNPKAIGAAALGELTHEAQAPEDPRLTALAHAQGDAEREALKLKPAPERGGYSQERVNAEAEAAIRADPQLPDKITAELEKKLRPLGAVETVVMERRKVLLNNELDRIRVLREAGDAIDQAEYRQQELDTLGKLERHMDLTDRAGSEAGGAFVLRQQLMAEDYSAVGMLRRATAAKGEPLTPEEQGQVQKVATKVAAATKAEKDAEAAFVSTGAKVPSPEFKDMQSAKVATKAAKGDFSEMVSGFKQKARTPGQKLSDWLIKARVNEVISGPTTLAKITAASLERVAFRPLEETAGLLWSKLPGIAKIAAMAPRQGRGLAPAAEKQALASSFTDGIKDAWRTIKTGQSTLDVLHGAPREARSWLDWQFSLHDAMKAPAVRNEYTRSFLKRLDFEAANGRDVTSPAALERMGLEAYKDAQSAKFRQENWLVEAYNKGINSLRANPNKIASATGTGLRLLTPVVRVPTNLAFEVATHVFGVPMGAVEAVHARFVKGLENLKPAEADAIMRHFKKGSLGLAALAIGYASPQMFGGYYSGKRDEKDVKVGAARIGGVEVPSWLLHNPFLEVFQVGATARRAADKLVGGKKEGPAVGAVAAAAGLAEEIPLVREGTEIGHLMSHNAKERGWFFGELAKSFVVPRLVEWLAGNLDKKTPFSPAEEPKKRKPEGVVQHIQTGVPVLRESVPVPP